MSLRGFPHSEIPGSKLVCSSPGLIAAYRVLHRLLAPRHSPYALSSLTIQVSELMPAGTQDSGVGMVVPRPRENSTVSACNSPLFVNTASVLKRTTVCRIFSCQRTVVTHRSNHAFEVMVENTGLEPVTSWLQTRRSPS